YTETVEQRDAMACGSLELVVGPWRCGGVDGRPGHFMEQTGRFAGCVAYELARGGGSGLDAAKSRRGDWGAVGKARVIGDVTQYDRMARADGIEGFEALGGRESFRNGRSPAKPRDPSARRCFVGGRADGFHDGRDRHGGRQGELEQRAARTFED